MKKIIVAGDSHTRSFALRKNLIPVFLGPGKEINLSSHNLHKVEKKLKQLIKKIKNIDYDLFLFLGEPNVRYQLEKGWYPFKDKTTQSVVNHKYLKECADNYVKLAQSFNAKLITPTSAYNKSVKGLKYFNKYLCSVNNVNVIDVFSKTIKSEKVREEFLFENLIEDPIHLNMKIADVFFEVLSQNSDKHRIFENHQKIIKPYLNEKNLKDIFKENRFGTLTLDDSNLINKISKKLLNSIYDQKINNQFEN